VRKRKLIPYVDYYPLRKAKLRAADIHLEPTIMPDGVLNKNKWADVIMYAQLHGYKAADIYNYIFNKHKPKTNRKTIQVAILLHEKLKLNERKSKNTRLSARQVILRQREAIEKIYGRREMEYQLSDDQIYRIGKKALDRAPEFILLTKAERKKLGL
jgi:hypothetical protein